MSSVRRSHRRQVHADLKSSALAHLPSATFTANAAWLVPAVMDFNLTRAAATIAGPTLARATTATIRCMLINVPARIASSARRLTLYLPSAWPWETASAEPFTRIYRRPRREGDDPVECGGLGSFAVGLILRLPNMGVRNVDVWQVHAVCHGHDALPSLRGRINNL